MYTAGLTCCACVQAWGASQLGRGGRCDLGVALPAADWRPLAKLCMPMLAWPRLEGGGGGGATSIFPDTPSPEFCGDMLYFLQGWAYVRFSLPGEGKVPALPPSVMGRVHGGGLCGCGRLLNEEGVVAEKLMGKEDSGVERRFRFSSGTLLACWGWEVAVLLRT